ncbi:MAG: adenylyltransferase/cytidyltransferase family protein [Acidobacteria bacterium]|nr:adenylyltransferase/cytidyltransferase family protein [Acidobacteriota bacterium]
MKLWRRAPGGSTPAVGSPIRRLAILPGSFNPPTLAHLALAEQALAFAPEVVLALPSAMPHKTFDYVGQMERLRLMVAACEPHPQFSVAEMDRGLFIEMARECRLHLGPQVEIAFVCGRDAAERIVTWKYEDGDSIERQLTEYSLLVAARQGHYEPPSHLAHRITNLPLDRSFDAHSATDVRTRLMEGLPWQHLVPEAIVPLVEKIYLRP